MNLFDELETQNKQIPLAEILRPKTLKEYFGQNQIISENSALQNLLTSKRLFSLLLWGTPGCGKTTFLRDIARKLSVDKKVCIIDERNEISGVNNCFNKNNMIDCLIGYKKSYGISLAIRTLSPQFIIFDEIGSFEECQGVCDSLNSGIKVITTVHCYDKKEFLSRPICNLLLKSNCFEYVVFLSEQAGEVSMVYKIKGDELCEYLEY